jgi:hypothetical protein
MQGLAYSDNRYIPSLAIGWAGFRTSGSYAIDSVVYFTLCKAACNWAPLPPWPLTMCNKDTCEV